MKNYLIQNLKEAYYIISLFIFLTSCNAAREGEDVVETEPTTFQQVEKLYQSDMAMTITYLDSLANTQEEDALKEFYNKARKYFKYSEPILAFADIQNYRFFNAPNILKIEEEDLTNIKIQEPSGFQVLEELIYADEIDTLAIRKAAELTRNRMKLVSKNTYIKKHEPYHFLWLIRNEINRITLTGITGFDSPVLENSLQEAAYAYSRLKDYFKIFEKKFNNSKIYEAWTTEIDKTINSLSGDFNSFDRYGFIKIHTHPQLTLWTKTVEDWKVEFPFTLALKNDATSLFSDNTFNMKYFADKHSGEVTEEKVLLGKMLFNDTRLSASGAISCATCHFQQKSFTDGKKISDGQTRNSPTLTYAGIQQEFFYDLRSGSLEGQVISVVDSETEFHSTINKVTEVVTESPEYKVIFSVIYEDSVTDKNIRNAIATYIRSLALFNSKFDKNINGKEQTLTDSEINGFNLFAGKAKCGTCHFAPVFNGTVPPEFTETEMELIGVPSENVLVNAQIDHDAGRYTLFQTEERRFFFKTPTVRNISKTAPYMHNGVFNTLEEVVEFYNLGGGAGIGIELEHQTLPPEPLNLTEEEKKDLVNFMKTLTDNET